MKAIHSQMLFELRRHLPTLAVGSTLLLIGPIVHRLLQGGWNYWDGEWNLAGATVAALAIAPLLALVMALSGGAAERSVRIFWTRLSTILGATVVWTLVALLVNGVFRWEPFLAPRLGGTAPVLLWLELVGWFLGAGLMASALFSRPGTALLGFVGTIAVLGVLVPFLLVWLVPTTWVLVYLGRDLGLLAAGHTYGITMAVALLLGAWGAMGRAPGERWRLSWPWKAAAAMAVVGAVATVVVMLQPLRIDASQVQAVRWLGDGTTLECARAPGVVPGRCHPVVRGRDGVAKPLRRSFSTPERMYAHPGRGVAVIDQLTAGSPLLGSSPGRWLVVDRRGEQRYLALPDGGQPIGWSHGGSYFAWQRLTQPRHPAGVSGLMLLDEDFEIRRQGVETPSADWTAVWIDDRRLLLTPKYYGVQPRQRGWWMVISADGQQAEVGPQPLPEGTFLFPPALASSPAPLTVRGNELAVLLSNGRDATYLAKLDLGSGELHPGAAVSLAGSGSLDTFGTLADGRAVWAEYVVATTEQADRGTSRIMTMPPSPAQAPREICRHFGLDQVFGSYRGTIGSWALWNGELGSRLYACHLGTGEVRILRNLGPLGPRSADLGKEAVLTADAKILLDEMRR